MRRESFQPISVKSPINNPISFKLRCIIDFQLLTIAGFLRTEMSLFDRGSIIDVGAGESPWRGWLPKQCLYQGVDIKSAAEFGMSDGGGDIAIYDGGIMPFEESSFSGALCIEVLEHAEDPKLLLSEIFRIIKPGAVMLLTVPWSARRHHIPYDYHRFTKERLAVLLSEVGFVDVRITERGNDYCVIANKLIINIIRNITNTRPSNFFYKIPFVGISSMFSMFIVIVSHISLLFKDNNGDDPLGYSCKAVKPQVKIKT